MKLHENEELFRETLTLAADNFGLNPSQIEKDYWTTEILRTLAESELKENIHFAGGTSLMKAYKVISRYSEDLDLYVDSNISDAGQNVENKLNSGVYNRIINDFIRFKTEKANQASGGTRRIHLNVNTLFLPDKMKSHLLIDTSITTTKKKAPTYHPWETRIVNSLAMEYLRMRNVELADSLDNPDFKCKCMSPKETICAKISRLTRTSEEPENFATKIRDLYDLTKLMSMQEYRDFVKSEEFIEAMFKTNMQDWLQHRRTHTQKSYTESKLFNRIEELMDDETVKKSLEDLEDLLFKNEVLPDAKTITEMIQHLKTRMSEFDQFNQQHKEDYVRAEFHLYFRDHTEKPTTIESYEFLTTEEKITGRICCLIYGEIKITLSIDYGTGDVCKTQGHYNAKTLSHAIWKTLDGNPAYFSGTRIVSMKNKHLIA